jgi:hypothetical protein
VELTSYWNDEHTGIFTSAVIAVDENVDNSTAQDSVNVTVLGGEAEGISEWVSDMPSFTQGEKTAVFLKKLERSQVPKSKFMEARLAEEQYEVYGGFKGKFAANDDAVGNLPTAKFKEAVSKIRRGESSPGVELDASLAVVTMPYSYRIPLAPSSRPGRQLSD